MDLEARKITFVQEFLRLQNEEIISALEKFMHTRKAELTERNMSPMSLEQLNTETDQSIEDAKSGRVIKAYDLRDKIKKWG